MFEFEFTSKVIRWQGKAAWHFILLPEDMSEEINRWAGAMKGGWGSVPVEASIGTTSWRTSIFPDKKRGTFLLPLKAEVRRAEGVGDGDSVDVTLSL